MSQISPFSPNYLERIRKNKYKKIDPINQTIFHNRQRIKTQQYSQQGYSCGNSLSFHKKREMKKLEKLNVNPDITSSNFFIQVFCPTVSSQRVNPKKRDMRSKDSKRSNSSQKKSNESSGFPEDEFHTSEMKRLMSFHDPQKTAKRLNKFSKQKGKSNIRIYKEDLHKIIKYRYGRDRMTTFLQTQYIQDFDSVTKTIMDLLKMGRQEMLTFVFLMIDMNKDGLITPDDLNQFIGVKRECQLNQLLMKDMQAIIQYVNKMRTMGKNLIDEPENTVIFKDQSLTLMKYRLHQTKKRKQIAKGIHQRKRRNLVSSRMHEHLFSLQKQRQTPQRIQFSMNDLFKFLKDRNLMKNNSSDKNNFSINFTTFKTIFYFQTPCTFIDFLYLYGGIEVPDMQYTQVYTKMIEPPPPEIKKEVNVDKFSIVLQRINQMKQFHHTTRAFRYRTQ